MFFARDSISFTPKHRIHEHFELMLRLLPACAMRFNCDFHSHDNYNARYKIFFFESISNTVLSISTFYNYIQFFFMQSYLLLLCRLMEEYLRNYARFFKKMKTTNLGLCFKQKNFHHIFF